MICSFSGLDNSSPVTAPLTFDTFYIKQGEKRVISGTEYTECLQSTFQICKIPCKNSDSTFSLLEIQKISCWLNRDGFYKLKFLADDYYDFYFLASFNITKIEWGNQIVGLELHMETDSPFAYHEPIIVKAKSDISNWKFGFIDSSQKEGYIYPHMELEIKKKGDLTISNNGRTTEIKNCVSGEIISFNYPVVTSSLSSHIIQDDFNWIFPRIENTFKIKKNQIFVSLPCNIKITYSPIVKIGV